MKKRYFFYYSLPFVVLIALYHNYFISSKIIAFGDFGYISKTLLSGWFTTLSYIWGTFHVSESYLPIINFFGFNFLAGAFAFFGIDYAVSSRLIFFIPYLVIAYSGMILLLRKLLGKDSIFIVLGAFIFILNPFMLLLAAWPNMAV